MRRVLALYSVLTKNAEMKVPKKGSKGSMYLGLAIIAVSCIMIPCCLIVGFISYIMTETIDVLGADPTSGLLAEIHIMSAFSVVFGMLVIFNILFFSSDREHLVPLPFKSWEILLAKFLYAYLAESVMEFLILISMFVGYFISQGVTIISLLSSIIGVILIPLVPLAYCAIIGLLLLVVLKNVKNRKFFDSVSTVMLFAFVLLFLCSFKDMGGITVENYVTSLADNTNLFSNVLSKIFFTVPWLLEALGRSNILFLLLYIVGNIGVVAIMTLIGKYTYQQSLYTVAALGSGKKRYRSTEKNNQVKSVFSSYLKKEYLVLTRTKAYNGNCVVINYLWPACVLGYILWNNGKESMQVLRDSIAAGNERAMVIMTIGVILLSFISSAMNSLASTAFTREGMHLDMIKYIPVPYRTQIYAKGLISIIITYPALLLSGLIAFIYFRFSVLWILFYAVIMLAVLVITTVIGLYMDSSHPHSTWDDEYSALRGNLNTFFDMAFVMVVSVILSALGFILYNFTGMGIMGFVILEGVIIIGAAVASLIIGPSKIIQNIKDL